MECGLGEGWARGGVADTEGGGGSDRLQAGSEGGGVGGAGPKRWGRGSEPSGRRAGEEKGGGTAEGGE